MAARIKTGEVRAYLTERMKAVTERAGSLDPREGTNQPIITGLQGQLKELRLLADYLLGDWENARDRAQTCATCKKACMSSYANEIRCDGMLIPRNHSACGDYLPIEG